MSKSASPRILPVIFTVIACLSGYYFQEMAYWSSRSMIWYWAGAICAYVFSVLSILLIVAVSGFGKGHTADEDAQQRLRDFASFCFTGFFLIINLLNLLWTTLVLIAGQSGM